MPAPLNPLFYSDSPQRKALEYTHSSVASLPSGLTPMDLIAAALSPIPGSGALQVAADLEHYSKGDLEPNAVNIGLTASNLLPFGALAGAVKGIRRFPPLYHGTYSTTAERLAQEGFTKGKSSELEIPGTSVTDDPSVAVGFAASNLHPGSAPTIQQRVVKVKPEYSPEDVGNLPPSAYFSGQVPDAPGYKKPNLWFQESELFTPRPEAQYDSQGNILTQRTRAPLQAVTLPGDEAARLAEMNYRVRQARFALSNFGKGAATSPGIPPVSMRQAADSIKALAGNRGAFTGAVDQLSGDIFHHLSAARKSGPTLEINNPELAQAAKEFPAETKVLYEAAAKMSVRRKNMNRLRIEVEQAARKPQTLMGENDPMVLREGSSLEDSKRRLDDEYRLYFADRNEFLRAFNNLAYNRESMRAARTRIDAPTRPDDLLN